MGNKVRAMGIKVRTMGTKVRTMGYIKRVEINYVHALLLARGAGQAQSS